jgi:RNA polymerase sigma-70 factor (ECF subfamily)
MGEVLWLEPYPDLLLEGIIDTAPGPEARYETREAISLAFVTALQLLPPRQRAALILRDVLDFSARELAHILETTEEAVTSALKRARATLARELPPVPARDASPPPGSAEEQDLVARFTSAFERGDVHGVVCLLTDRAWVRMPPLPLEYQGRELATQFFAVAFRDSRQFRLIPTRANRQPAFGLYYRDPHAALAHANGLLVLTLAGHRINAITHFETSVLPRFGLPRTIPD